MCDSHIEDTTSEEHCYHDSILHVCSPPGFLVVKFQVLYFLLQCKDGLRFTVEELRSIVRRISSLVTLFSVYVHCYGFSSSHQGVQFPVHIFYVGQNCHLPYPHNLPGSLSVFFKTFRLKSGSSESVFRFDSFDGKYQMNIYVLRRVSTDLW